MASCGFSAGPIPADHYYRLPEAVAKKLNQPVVESFLLNPVKVEGLYHERSILYVQRAAPLEVQRYHYHYWVEPPAKLVRKYMQKYLSAAGISRNLLLNVSSYSADIEADITIVNFERIVAQGGAQILVGLQIEIKYNKDSTRVSSHYYSAKVTAKSSSLHATVEAFGQALNKIMHAFVNDLTIKTL
jgi:ABC-type uncharacterized transport system auxiliary subunit